MASLLGLLVLAISARRPCAVRPELDLKRAGDAYRSGIAVGAMGETLSDFWAQVLANEERAPQKMNVPYPETWVDKLDVDNKSEVGHGAYGTVYLVKVKCSENIVMAIKEQLFTQSASRESVEGEIDVMGRFRGKHFVNIYDSHLMASAGLILMEAARGGDLRKIPKDEPFAVKFLLFVQALQGLALMHAAGYLHRDIKPDNIILSKDCASSPYYAKVADLGFACSLSPGRSDTCKGVAGTPAYTPPEVWNGMNVSSKHDVWSMGFLLHQLAYGDTPVPWLDQTSTNYIRSFSKEDKKSPGTVKVIKSKLKELFVGRLLAFDPEKIRRKQDPLLDNLLVGMLQPDPEQRLTAQQALDMALELARERRYSLEDDCADRSEPPPCMGWKGSAKHPTQSSAKSDVVADTLEALQGQQEAAAADVPPNGEARAAENDEAAAKPHNTAEDERAGEIEARAVKEAQSKEEVIDRLLVEVEKRSEAIRKISEANEAMEGNLRSASQQLEQQRDQDEAASQPTSASALVALRPEQG